MEKLQPILQKLKGVVDHLEKIILGVVLIAVAVLSVLKLLGARKELEAVHTAAQDLTFGGQLRKEEDIGAFSNLVRTSREDPPAIILDGTNHTVFNPDKWSKYVVKNTNGITFTNLMRDSVKRPLGISATHVSEIREVKLMITPRIQKARGAGRLGENNMRYTFEAIDEYPTVPMRIDYYMARNGDPRFRPYWKSYAQLNADDRLRSFMPQVRPYQAGVKARSDPLQPSERRAALPLFPNYRGNPYANRSWEVYFRFTKATRTDDIDAVKVYLDVIRGMPNGTYFTNKNEVAMNNKPLAYTRGYEADLVFQTEFDPKPIRWLNCRVGRRISIDREVFRIIRIDRNVVHLQSDSGFGGNGQIYDKPWHNNQPGQPGQPNLNIPVPGAATNAAPTNAVPARPPPPAPLPAGQ